MFGSRKKDKKQPLFQLPPPGQRGSEASSEPSEPHVPGDEERARAGATPSEGLQAPSTHSASRTSKHRARGAPGGNPFGHLVEGRQGNLLGMSSRTQRTFFIMIVTCSILIVVVLTNVFGVWHGAQRSMDEYREAQRENDELQQQRQEVQERYQGADNGLDETAAANGDDAASPDEQPIRNGGAGGEEAPGPTVEEAAEALAEQIGAALEGESEARLVVFPPVTDGRVLDVTAILLDELEMELALAIAGRGRLISAERLARMHEELGYARADLASQEVRLLIAERLEATHLAQGELTPRRDGTHRWRIMVTDLADDMIVGGGRFDLALPPTAADEDVEPDEPTPADPAEAEPQTQPEVRDVDDDTGEEEPAAGRPAEPDHTDRVRFEEISQHYERPLPMRSAMRERIGNTLEDVFQYPHAEWHSYLLREVPSLDPEMVKERAVGMYDTTPDWFDARPHQEGLLDALGHAYTVEGTVWSVREVRTSELGLEDEPLVDGEPQRLVWRGLVVFRYTRYLHERPFRRPEYAAVLFTATDVPDWLRQYRVMDETKKPLRVRLTGLLMHLRPDREHESGLVSDELSTDRQRRPPYYPQVVASSIERLPAKEPEVDRELLDMVDDGIASERRIPPKVAQQNLLYRLQWLDEERLQSEFYDRAVEVPSPDDVEHGRLGYHDLKKQPATYRQEPVVVRMRGQVAQIGEDVRNPVLPYKLRPNPYGIREQWIGAMTILDERGAQQNVLYDALKIKLWDPHEEEYYLYEGPEAERPSGGSQPPAPFSRGDEVEITGYFLWVFRYDAKSGDVREVPRLVVHTVRQLPPNKSPTDTLTTVFLIFMGVSLVVIFVLFRRESRSASSYRTALAKRQLEKSGGLKPRANTMAAQRLKQKLEQKGSEVPGAPPPPPGQP